MTNNFLMEMSKMIVMQISNLINFIYNMMNKINFKIVSILILILILILISFNLLSMNSNNMIFNNLLKIVCSIIFMIMMLLLTILFLSNLNFLEYFFFKNMINLFVNSPLNEHILYLMFEAPTPTPNIASTAPNLGQLPQNIPAHIPNQIPNRIPIPNPVAEIEIINVEDSDEEGGGENKNMANIIHDHMMKKDLKVLMMMYMLSNKILKKN